MKGRVLVTGAAGFIGSHVVDALLARGYEVTALDNLQPQVHADAELDAEGWPTYLDPRARRLRGDVLNEDDVAAGLEGATHLVHLAASVGVGQSMSNICDYTRNNVLGAAVVLQALTRRPHTVRRMAVASSMSIYGEGAYRRVRDGAWEAPHLRSHAQLAARRWEPEPDGEALEPAPTGEAKPLQPMSIYAVNKRDHEEMFLAVGRALGIPTVALRLFNAYGSRQALSNPYTGVAAIFISRLLNDQPPLVFEDGEQMRDFVHVGDVADAFVAALEDEQEMWEAMNVGSGGAISIRDMATVLARLLRKNIAPEILQRHRVGDIRHCFADVSKIRTLLGWAPRRSFEAGMEELIGWVGRAKPPVDRSRASLAELEASRLVI
ncbi:MAG: NAD-dependent epimerase/dehydratase family protein [Caulobacteraceae bacterium]|nr:NAD-dependent epimerase/dehydratase family protein [Caulobacter sp.]